MSILSGLIVKWFLVSCATVVSVIIRFILSHLFVPLSPPRIPFSRHLYQRAWTLHVEKMSRFRIFPSHRLPSTYQFGIRMFVLLSCIKLSSLDPCNCKFIMIDMAMAHQPGSCSQKKGSHLPFPEHELYSTLDLLSGNDIFVVTV